MRRLGFAASREQRLDPGLGGCGLVTEELALPDARGRVADGLLPHRALVRRLLPSPPLLLHALLERLQVDVRPLVRGELHGQLDGEPVGVVEPVTDPPVEPVVATAGV